MPVTSQNYQVILDAKINSTTLNKQLSDISKKNKGLTFTDSTKGVKALGDAAKKTNGFATGLLNTLNKFNASITAIRSIVYTVQQLTEATFELNKAQTEFRKVSDLSGQALDAYTQKAAKAGEATAKTSAQMIDAATEFRKSGFSDEDSLTLAKTASLFQNVADSELSAGDAATVIISNLKAFNMTAQDSTKIIDVINEV